MAFPKPPISSDVDLRDFAFMRLDVDQLLNSDTWILATGDEAKAAITLWCRAWHQKPAGSLPNNDRILAVLSGAGPLWESVKEVAIRGFRECSDGRLYHSRIVEKAIEAWDRKNKQKEKSKAGAAARWGNKQSQTDASGIPQAMPKNANRQGQGQGQGEKNPPDSASQSCAPQGAPDATQPVRRKDASGPEKRLPPDWNPGDAGQEYGHKLGLTDEELREEYLEFREHFELTRKAWRDWDRVWQRWCREAVKRRHRVIHREPSRKGGVLAALRDLSLPRDNGNQD